MKYAIYPLWTTNVVRVGVQRSIQLSYGYIRDVLYYAGEELSMTGKEGKIVSRGLI